MPTKKKPGRPPRETKREVKNTAISMAAHKFISDEAKLQKRSFIDTLDYILGV